MAQFGLKQINNPTPASINLVVRIVTVFIAVFLAWMNSNDNMIGDAAQHWINSIAALTMGLINGIAPLFGIAVNSPTIPTGDVTAVKNEGK